MQTHGKLAADTYSSVDGHYYIRTENRSEVAKALYRGGTEPAKEMAAELVRRWNCHAQLLEACKVALAELEHFAKGLNIDDIEAIPTLRAAIAAATKTEAGEIA